ncbi:MAG: 4Fe-4S binding protein [Marinilabiliales bacterium]|nr:4Fe-4S binding protein [Marinilabiliales bacterium]
MNRSNPKPNLPRKLLQWGVIFLLILWAFRAHFQHHATLDYEAYCPFGGLQAFTSYLINDSLACSMTATQVAMGLALAIGLLLVGKLFCAFLCPIGTLSEALSNLGKKLKINIKIGSVGDKILRAPKYLLLFLTFYFTLESSELFCKKFDPYFAVTSGFGGDVVLWYALASLTAVVVGSLLIRLFWCRYLCPLGALSNLFRFGIFVPLILGLYFLLMSLHLTFSFLWVLAAFCLGGYLLEIRKGPRIFSPITRIARNTTSCTSCNLCTRSCPQAIPVAKLKEVTHIDCHLCGDCLKVCPEEQTLRINHKNSLHHLPWIATLLLVGLGFLISMYWEIPTINQRWAEPLQPGNTSELTQSGLKEIKCYGSSMAFAAKMKEVKGVLGVATFVSTHKVKVLYDPTQTNEQTIRATLFTPQRSKIREEGHDTSALVSCTVGLENFFDPSDFNHLQLLLKEKSQAIAIESNYSCPVLVTLYFRAHQLPDVKEIIRLLETPALDYTEEGETIHLPLDFKVTGQPRMDRIETKAYRIKMFRPYDRTFNHMDEVKVNRLDTLAVPLGNQIYNFRILPYLVSHLSNDDGVKGFRSVMDTTGTVHFEIIFVDSLTRTEAIQKALRCDTLTFTYEDGDTGKVVNVYKF